MEIFLFWFGLSIVVGMWASGRGRAGFGYFLLSLVLSPLLIALLVLVLPNLKAQPVLAGAEVATAATHTRCPECRELVRKDARKCKHCGTELTPLLEAGGR